MKNSVSQNTTHYKRSRVLNPSRCSLLSVSLIIQRAATHHRGLLFSQSVWNETKTPKSVTQKSLHLDEDFIKRQSV